MSRKHDYSKISTIKLFKAIVRILFFTNYLASRLFEKYNGTALYFGDPERLDMFQNVVVAQQLVHSHTNRL